MTQINFVKRNFEKIFPLPERNPTTPHQKKKKEKNERKNNAGSDDFEVKYYLNKKELIFTLYYLCQIFVIFCLWKEPI